MQSDRSHATRNASICRVTRLIVTLDVVFPAITALPLSSDVEHAIAVIKLTKQSEACAKVVARQHAEDGADGPAAEETEAEAFVCCEPPLCRGSGSGAKLIEDSVQLPMPMFEFESSQASEKSLSQSQKSKSVKGKEKATEAIHVLDSDGEDDAKVVVEVDDRLWVDVYEPKTEARMVRSALFLSLTPQA